jgi:hypothetical protein
MQRTIKSEYIHDNIYDKAYIAKLSIDKNSNKFNRIFLSRSDIKIKAYDWRFIWNILKAGVYEKREQHHYQGEITYYFAVNYNGDVIKLIDKKVALALLKKGIRSWGRSSPLRIQMLNHSFIKK